MANNFEYNLSDAQGILAGCAGLLLPLIRSNQVAGCDWLTNARRIVESESDDVRLALFQLFKLSRYPMDWLDDPDDMRRAAGLSRDDMVLLTGLLPVYLTEHTRLMYKKSESIKMTEQERKLFEMDRTLYRKFEADRIVQGQGDQEG